MLILDTLTKIKNGSIDIPDYHRGHLSLKTGTSVTLCFLPCQQSDTSPRLTEMVISPVAFDSWRYLTRINARLYDKPGVVRKLASAVRARGLNILYEASGPIENRKLHRVEFLVDARNFYQQFEEYRENEDSNIDYIVLAYLERWLKAFCMNELVFDRTRLRLKVRPMEGFRNAHNNFYRCLADPRSDSQANSRPFQERAAVEKGKIALPENILNAIPDVEKRVLLISDTKDRVLRAFFLHPEEHYTYARVLHADSESSLATISSCLSESFFTITTLSRLKKQRERNDVELLLFSPNFPLENQEEERKKLIEKILSQSKLKHLDIEVSYPDEVGKLGPNPHKPASTSDIEISASKIPNLLPPESEIIQQGTSYILKKRIEDFQEHISNESNLSKVAFYRHRLEAARELLSHSGEEKIPSPRIFISYNFKFNFLFNIIRDNLRDHKCDVINGSNPIGESERFRDEIISRIRSSYGFIAIWKMDMEKEKDERFSPWMLWELGVAQAFGMPYFIFAHKNLENLKTSPHRRINPEQHHSNFEDAKLEGIVNATIPSFLEKVYKHEKRRFLNGKNSFSATN